MIYLLLLTFIAIIFCFSFDNGWKEKINIACKLSYGNLLSLRGVLVIVIIYHHLVVCCSLDIKSELISYLFAHLGYLCVAVFLFLSGLGLEYKYNLKGNSYLCTIPLKIVFFLVVYLNINTLYLISSPLYSSYTVTLKGFCLGLIDGHPLSGPSWFLLNLIALYLIYFVSKKLKFSLLFIILGISSLNLIYWFFSYSVIWGISNLSFIVGILASKFLRSREICISPLRMILYSGVLLMLFAFTSFLPEFNYGNIKYLCQLISTPFFSLLVIILYSLFVTKRNWFAFLGKHSLEIFLIHVLVYKILRGNYIYIENELLYVFLVMIISIVISIPLRYVNQYLAKYIR